MTHRVAGEDLVETLQAYYSQCRVAYLDSLNILKNGLGPTTDPRDQVFGRFGCWPAITADGLLRYLASTFLSSIPPHWKKCLTLLALLLLDLQRSRRLLWYALDGLEEELAKELENEGCDRRNPEDYPDWLLIQVSLFHPNAHLHSHRSWPLSDTRKLSHSSNSGRNHDGDHVPAIWSKHGDAGQHGRREIIRHHPYRCCCSCGR